MRSIFFGSEGLGLEGSTALAAACARALNETGHVGRPNNGLIGVWQRANDQGAWEIGFEPGGEPAGGVRSGGGGLHRGRDPIGDGALKLKSGRRKPFIVVQDLFETETAQVADVVLPAQTYMEREGTFTSGERRVQRFYRGGPGAGGDQARFCHHGAGGAGRWA